ncbi:MAG: hypothetical protein K0S28_2322, partial [Paucimonas sp.]|nr:hypothetical protein [Paucimonas sp.]
FSGAQLARTISSDIVLVGEVVRLANSSYYNPAQPITSIESAILVLGHNGLRQLVTGVAFKPIIDMKSGRYTKRLAQHLWDHSETCAAACRQLAAGTGIDPFEAFLTGLVQNVGMIAALRIMDQIGDDGQEIGSPSFYSSLVRHTRSLTGSISREWRFPESVTKALEEQGQGGRLSDVSPLGKVLYVADYLVKLRTLIDEKSVKETPALTRGLNEREAAVLQDIRTARA